MGFRLGELGRCRFFFCVTRHGIGPNTIENCHVFIVCICVSNALSSLFVAAVASGWVQVDPKGWVWSGLGFRERYTSNFLMHVLEVRGKIKMEMTMPVCCGLLAHDLPHCYLGNC